MNQRTKGHNFERWICKLFRENLNHDCKTTRSLSKGLDDCGIDVVGTDVIIQAKAGYENRRPRFEEIYKSIKERIDLRYGKTHRLHEYPIVLIHNIDVGKGNKRGPEYTTVTLTLEDYFRLRRGELPQNLEIL